MGGGTRTKTTQEPQVPQYLSDLTQTSGERIKEYQAADPLTGYAKASPLKVAPLSARESTGFGMIPQIQEQAKRRVTGETILNSPSYQAANKAYETAIMPGIENRATLSGLGRSTALTNADAAARAAYLQPTIENIFGQEERGLQGEQQAVLNTINAYSGAGATERGIEQAGYEAEKADEMR